MLAITVVVVLFGACTAMTTPATPAPTTQFLFDDCNGHRTHPTDPKKFIIVSNGILFERDCPEFLVWDQDVCACEDPPCENEDPNCWGHRPVDTDPHKFEICLHGVWRDVAEECPVNQIWNQTACWCDWGPHEFELTTVVPVPGGAACLTTIFNATFDKNIQDDGRKRYSIGRIPWESARIDSEEDGIVGVGAVRVEQGALPLWFTSRNDFSNHFMITIRFKVIDNRQGNFEDLNILSNDCGHDKTTFNIHYGIIDQHYSVFFRNETSVNGSSIHCTALFPPFEFHELSLEYKDNRTILRADGNLCLNSTVFEGKLGQTLCPMQLGGRLPGSRQKFNGYFDEVVFRRDCAAEV